MRRVKVKDEQPDPQLVAEVVEAIRAGRSVALPTETVYGLAADPANPAAVARLQATKGRAARHAFTHHVGSHEQADAVVLHPAPRVERLLRRFWPGPLTAVLPRRGGGDVGVRVPAHRFTAEVLAAFPLGLYLSSVNRTGEPPAVTPDQVANMTGLDLLIDGGPPALGVASTVVRYVRGDLEILREGALLREEITAAAVCRVLFVCTGNTCRSPLAEVIARRRLADRFGVGDADLAGRGLVLQSAGIFASPGAPASQAAVRAARELGLDLGAHRARPLDDVDLTDVDLVYAMGHSHALAVGEAAPWLGDRVRLLDPADADLPDPFGGDLEVYRATRDAIDAALRGRLPEMVALVE